MAPIIARLTAPAHAPADTVALRHVHTPHGWTTLGLLHGDPDAPLTVLPHRHPALAALAAHT